MQHLGKNVVAGGVVYPAGTRETPELRELIAERHWVGEPTEAAAPRPDVDVTETPEYVELKRSANEALANAKKAIEDLTEQVAALTTERDNALARAEAAEQAAAAPVPPAPAAGDPSEPVKRTRQRTRTTSAQAED